MGVEQIPSKTGINYGNTASRPSNPTIGETYYNGEAELLEIYNGSEWVPNSSPPSVPTISSIIDSSATDAYSINGGKVSVNFIQGSSGGPATQYTARTTSGGFAAASSTTTVLITGLAVGTTYTIYGTASNNFGTSAESIEYLSITPSTKPQSPIIGTATDAGLLNGTILLTFTPRANGGKDIINYKYSTDGVNYIALSPAQTTSPLTISGLTSGVPVTIRLKAVNSNGDSDASDASNSITPVSAKASGGTVIAANGYIYHKFTSTGTFIPNTSISNASVLTIAGGGGGTGGSGGAGGVINTTGVSFSSGVTYTATVGAGGAGNIGWSSGIGGTSGNNSNVTGGSLSLTAAVGGGGAGGGWTGTGNGANAKSGGSGGGGESRYTVGGANVKDTGGAGTSGQGNNGGNGELTGTSSNLKFCHGGGGGAGSAGGNANGTSISGSGGNGTSAYSTWGIDTSSGVNVGGVRYFAAAPGGGNAGKGADGIGYSNSANTGNGGLGQASTNVSGNSGIIIIRYQ